MDKHDNYNNEREKKKPTVCKRASRRPEKEKEGSEDELTHAEWDSDVNKHKPRNSGLAQATPNSSASKGAKARTQTSKAESPVEDEDSEVTFIPLPKLRDDGGIPYQDGFVHPNTMTFLRELKAHNQRVWLKMRDAEFRRSLKDWETLVGALTEKMIEADETIPELPLKDVMFRIYRDVRFSNDPTPYKVGKAPVSDRLVSGADASSKPHYSAAWSRTGRKGRHACYYVHCEPGSCFVGGGLWHPDKNALAKIRASIDERRDRIHRELMKPEFRRTFFPAAKSGEKSVVAAFVALNQENALKRCPKGFNPDHRDVELLKLKNFTVSRKMADSDITGPDAQDKIMAIIKPMVDYVTFLNKVVMPDGDSDESSEETRGNVGTDAAE